MGKFITKFENHTEYEEARQNLILPNVSLCVAENEVYYNPHVDPYNGHAYVDLGLPSGTKWATMNVGATSETDYGLYFQWGDTQGYTADQVGSGEGQKYFAWADYKWNKDGDAAITLTKYNETDGKTVLEASDDAAVANWGGDWHMPTEAQLQELLDNTNNERTMVNNVNGYKFTNKTDDSKYIFIPANGLAYDGSIKELGSYGNVWISSLKSSSDVERGHCLFFRSEYVELSDGDRIDGYSVRPVVG